MIGAGHWRIAEQDLVRLRRLLGLPRLPQHECTCGRCFAWVAADEWCDGHRLDVLDELAAFEERSRHLSDAAGEGRFSTMETTTHADAVAEQADERRCQSCGCTDNDCSACIERTGFSCFWITDGLCSACASLETLLELTLALLRAGQPLEPISRLTALCAAGTDPKYPGAAARLRAPALVNGPGLVPPAWKPVPKPSSWRVVRMPQLRVIRVSPAFRAFLDALPAGVATEAEMPIEFRRELGWAPVCVAGGRVHADGEACDCEWANAKEFTHRQVQAQGPAPHLRIAQAPLPGDAATPAPPAESTGLRDRLQYVYRRSGCVWRVSASVDDESGNLIENGEVAVRVQWDFSGGPALINASIRRWQDDLEKVRFGTGRHIFLTVTEARHLASALTRASARAMGRPAPVLADGFALWQTLAQLLGDPALAFAPELLVARLVERLNVLEASRMPDEPELGALMRAAAGLPRELLLALRGFADALETWQPDGIRVAHRALTDAVTAYIYRREAAPVIDRVVDAPDVVAQVLSFAGLMVKVEVIAKWTTEQRRAALEWAMGKHSTVPEFLSESTGDA